MDDNLKILIVDDSPSVQSQLRRMMSRIDKVEIVGTALDGVEAMEFLSKQVPDLVILDIIMPRMDGMVVLQEIKKANIDVRVIVISSLAGSRAKAEEAYRLGAVEVMSKPVNNTRMSSILQYEYQRKKLQK